MRCAKHNVEAMAICSYCGRALCPDCVSAPNAARLVCSANCGAALTRGEQAVQMILHRSMQSSRASAFYCYVSGGLSAVAAVGAYFVLPSPFLIYFTGGCAVILIASGIGYSRGAKSKPSLPPDQSAP